MKQKVKIQDKAQAEFDGCKSDIQCAWDNPIRPDSRITRDWIYAVDPETMTYVKAMWSFMPKHYSLYNTFTAIMKGKSFVDVLTKAYGTELENINFAE